jgi:hypothetical protein
MVAVGCRYDVLEDDLKIEEIDNFSNTQPYPLQIPPFFPPMDIPSDNPLTVQSVNLGRYLFWEKKT